MYKVYNKNESKEEIKRLVDQFYADFGNGDNPQRIAGKGKEARVEDKYIKPLFALLNWNIHNTGEDNTREEFRVQTSLQLKNTVVEPDYELWIPDKETMRMKRVLFVEAKDPKYNLHTNEKYIRQAYQYAHSTLNMSDHEFNRCKLSILTDFEEFRLFDCSDPYPLTKKDANIFNKHIVEPFDFKCSDYVDKFSLLWDTFERNNVFNGSLNDYFVSDSALKKSRIAPDLKFLDDLKKWRLLLAKSMFKSNKEVSDSFLTSASQIMINRIIFLKMLTDRAIEVDYLTMILDKIKKEKEELSIYDSCREIFEILDRKYNGDIFKKRIEFDHVQIENKVFSEIIEALRPENSVYSLAAMPVEIIGNAYEQFLGEVITHKGRGISSEQKTEVQKAGGVYYTPRYIVDYIVSNTVGVLLKKCKTPEDVSKLKILDPACGSGSFLIRVYDFIIDWHLAYYKSAVNKMIKSGKDFSEIKKKYQKEIKIYQDENNKHLIHLTSKLKKQILLDNIHGVDIDSNAVEITIFSLCMKALENETEDELNEDIGLFSERILPTLNNNIKCGNSLIDRETLLANDMFGDEDIKPFDWKSDFNFEFDAIVGNPPYIRIQEMQAWAPKTVEIYKNTYLSGQKGNFDIYVLFIEKSMTLLSNRGVFGMILPNKFFMADYGVQIRSLIKDNIFHIVDFGDQQVFENATTYTNLLFLRKDSQETLKYVKVKDLSKFNEGITDTINGNIELKDEAMEMGQVENSTLSSETWQFSFGKDKKIFNKILRIENTLDNITDRILVGLQTSADPIYILEFREEKENSLILYSKENDRNIEIEKMILKPLLKGKEIRRFSTPEIKFWLIFPYQVIDGVISLCTKSYLESNFPLCWEYLNSNKTRLLKRADLDTSIWWEYPYPKNLDLFDKPKLITQVLASRASFTADLDGKYYFVGGGNAGGYGVKLKPEYEQYYHYVLGILNSKAIDKYLRHISTPFRGGFFSYAKRFIEKLPIYIPDTSDKLKFDLCKKIEEYVKMILEFRKSDSKQADADFLEKKIDQLVYQLYDLTPDEIKIVEGE